jgi:hypothetical protein
MNHAACGLFMFSRDDGEAVDAFEARVRAAVAKLGGGAVTWGEDLSIEIVDGVSEPEREAFTVMGGLPPMPVGGDNDTTY